MQWIYDKSKKIRYYIPTKDNEKVTREDLYRLYNQKTKIYKNGYFTRTTSTRNIWSVYRPSDWSLKSENKKTKREVDRNYSEENYKKTIDKLYDIILMNEFDWFVTLTFSKEEVDRYNPKEIMKKLREYLSNQVKRKNLKYLLIPEYHKNGAIHCHALMSGDYKVKYSGTKLVKGYKNPVSEATIRQRKIKPEDIRNDVWNIVDWKYGWSTAIKIYSKRPSLYDPLDNDDGYLRIAQYLLKYITKDACKIFGKYYWSSKNIDRNPDVQYNYASEIKWYNINTQEVDIKPLYCKFKYETNIFKTVEDKKKIYITDDEEITQYLEALGNYKERKYG